MADNIDYRAVAQYLRDQLEPNAAQSAREAAAQRMRQSARPSGGRQEGPVTRGAEWIGENMIIPQSPLDVATYALGGPFSRSAKIAALALGGLLTADEAQAGSPASMAERALRAAGRFVMNPERAYRPGIYKNPRVIAEEAAARVAPEHPAMKELFGVTRGDLYDIGGRGTRAGNIEGSFYDPVANPKGSYAAEAIMNPRNAQRMIDTMAEAQKYPGLITGPDSWYVMDPMYQRMVQLIGPERAKAEYQKFNTVVPMFSPGSPVPLEINRGTAANMMLTRGEWDKFMRHAGTAVEDRGRAFPPELRDVQAHPYHKTSQAGAIERSYLGDQPMKDPKVPLYMQASGVPETGFQTNLPVPDAHFTRAAGMSDVRKNLTPGESMSMTEYRDVGPWYRENVAQPLGVEAVPAQARMWTVFGPQTGVETPLGAPKLEIISQAISDRAAKLGIDPKRLRDDVLLGKAHASWLMGALAPLALGAAGQGDQAGATAPF